MRIAMIGTKGIPVALGEGGGIERVVEQLAPRLVEKGHEVSVYVRPYFNPQKRTKWEGVCLVTLPCIRRRLLETISHTFVSILHAVRQRYDVIHIHGVGPSVLAWLPRILSPRTKVVVTFHARDKFHEPRNVLARLFLSFGEWTAVLFPHATIAVSRTIQQFCREELNRTVVFIPNGVDVVDVPIGTDRLKAMGLEPNSYFLGMGRLVQYKAFDVALDAYREVKSDLLFAIAGGAGYDVRYASQLLNDALDDSRVRLLGFKSGEDLQQLIAHAYAVVHPSRIEGLSLSVLEAMSYGKLVIMSNIPENIELADHSAIAVPVDTRKAFRDAISWAIQDPAMVKERGIRAKEHVRNHFSWNRVARETESLYRALVLGRKIT